jgi:hypothetical protein
VVVLGPILLLKRRRIRSFLVQIARRRVLNALFCTKSLAKAALHFRNMLPFYKPKKVRKWSKSDLLPRVCELSVIICT